MHEIRHVVFDIGRVLLHWDAELIYKNRIPDAGKRKWFLENICSPEWNLERDRGVSFADGEAELIAKSPDQEENIRAFFTDWHLSIPFPIDGTEEIMRSLVDQGVDVTLLTNFSAQTYPRAVDKYPFLSLPRGATVSGDVKLLKPDPAIYAHHTHAFSLEIDKTLFIDDSLKNVDGAKAYGWQALLFTNAKTLKADLERFAITAA